MARAAVLGSAKAQGRQGTRTDHDVVSAADFAKAIAELDGDSETKNIMVYGDSGCGKTVLAGSCPNSLVLACEPGYISAARVDLGVPVGKRKVRKIADGATLLAGLDWLEAGGYKKFDWVVLEGASTLETKVRLGYAAAAYDNNPQSRSARNLPDKPDYFNTQNFLKGAIARLVDLPVNVLVTAHVMRMDDDQGDRLVLPAFQQRDGALSNYVSGLMHSVGFMRKRSIREKDSKKVKEVRRILWQQYADPDSGTIYFAKDQFDAFGRWTDNTNIHELMRKIDAHGAE